MAHELSADNRRYVLDNRQSNRTAAEMALMIAVPVEDVEQFLAAMVAGAVVRDEFDDDDRERLAEYGSWVWHTHPMAARHGGFVSAMTHAIPLADALNIERLRKAFPQLVAAFQMPDQFKAPPGFVGNYNEDTDGS